MLYPDAPFIPVHVPAERIVDHDLFVADAPAGDFAAAMVRRRWRDRDLRHHR